MVNSNFRFAFYVDATHLCVHASMHRLYISSDVNKFYLIREALAYKRF